MVSLIGKLKKNNQLQGFDIKRVLQVYQNKQTVRISACKIEEDLAISYACEKDVREVVEGILASEIKKGLGSLTSFETSTISNFSTALNPLNNQYKMVRELSGHEGLAWSVAVSPSGELIASASADQTIKIWNEWDTIYTLRGHSNEVKSVAFSASSEFLISGSYDETVKVWNANTGEYLRSFDAHSQGVRAVAVSPDNSIIASCSADKTVSTWDVYGKLISTFKGHSGSVNCLAFSDNSKMVVSGSSDKSVIIWEAESANVVNELVGHTGSVYSIAWRGSTIASGGYDKMLRVWNSIKGDSLYAIAGHVKLIRSIDISTCENYIVTGSETIRVWNNSNLVQRFPESTGVNSVKFCSENNKIISSHDDCIIRIWEFS